MNLKVNMPETLHSIVFGGGGTNGPAHIGVVHALEQYYKVNTLYDISGLCSYFGVSVGSIICLFCICGFKSKEILDVVYNFDFNSITNSLSLANFIDGYGFASLDCLISVLENAIAQKGFCKDITLKELYDITGKEYTVSSVCMNSYKTEYFSHDNHPGMKVMDIIRMSCAVPFIFKTVTFDNKIYIDGGTIEQMPTELITDSSRTLCIIFYRDRDLYNNNCISNAEDYLVNCASCIYISYEEKQLNVLQHKLKNVVMIKIKGQMNPVNCGMSHSDIYEMYLSGFFSVFDF